MAAHSRTILLRTLFLLAVIWTVYHSTAQSDPGLAVEIRDDATGQIVPAMVCITSLADHTWRTPPDGTAPASYSKVRDFYDPPSWQPGQIGPIRLTSIETRDNQGRTPTYEGAPSYPYWHEPAAYFVSQPFAIKLPAGRWRLAVARGVEFLPYTEEFDLAAAQTVRRTIRLHRWVDMPKLGWYSGDTHVHFPRLTPEHDQLLLTWARAEDLHVANILRMGDIERTYFEQSAYGKPSRHQQDDYLLVTGEEDPRTDIAEQGHVVSLNITAPIRDVPHYHLYDTLFDEAHRQGALTGYAHLAWAPTVDRKQDPTREPTWDTSINVIRNKLDFFEVLQFRHLGLEYFYDFLNLGIKLTAAAGSDVPWGSSIGEVRTYAYTGPGLIADKWFAAVKAGHTFVTNGPMLTLTAGTAIPGDDLQLAKPGQSRIRAKAWAPPEIGKPKLLEIIADGNVIRSAPDSLDFTLDITRSQWLAARVTSENGAVAHTSPIYVILKGQTFRDREQAPQIVAKRLKVLDFILDRLNTPRFVRDYAPGEVEALRARIAQARQAYEKLLVK